MGLSIKNDKVEALVREYADARGIGVTDAVEKAIQIAQHVERTEKSEAVRQQAAKRFLEIADQGWASNGEAWNRDELHTR